MKNKIISLSILLVTGYNSINAMTASNEKEGSLLRQVKTTIPTTPASELDIQRRCNAWFYAQKLSESVSDRDPKSIQDAIFEETYFAKRRVIAWFTDQQVSYWTFIGNLNNFNAKVGGQTYTIPQMLDNMSTLPHRYKNQHKGNLISQIFRGTTDHPYTVDTVKTEILVDLIRSNSIAEIKTYLAELKKEKVDLDLYTISGNSPIIIAVLHDHIEIVELLLQCGACADISSAYGYSPYNLARSTRMKNLLLAYDYPLLKAVRANDFKTVHTLLSTCDVNWQGIGGKTALHWNLYLSYNPKKTDSDLDLETFMRENIDRENINRLLLKAGARENIADDEGITAIMMYCQNLSMDKINEALLQKRITAADLSMHGREGETPLTLTRQAIKKESKKKQQYGLPSMTNIYQLHIHCLIQSNASVNALNKASLTPLMTAATAGNIDQIKLLIDCKADPKCKKEKDTALNMAIEQYQTTSDPRYKDVIAYLKSQYEVPDEASQDEIKKRELAQKTIAYATLVEEKKRMAAQEKKARLEQAKLKEQKEKVDKEQREKEQREAQLEQAKKAKEQQDRLEQEKIKAKEEKAVQRRIKQEKKKLEKQEKEKKEAQEQELALTQKSEQKRTVVGQLCPSKYCLSYLEKRYNAGQAAVLLARKVCQVHGINPSQLSAGYDRSSLNKFLLEEHRKSRAINWYLSHLKCEKCPLTFEETTKEINKLAKFQNNEKHKKNECN